MDIYFIALIALMITVISRDQHRNDINPKITSTVTTLLGELKEVHEQLDASSSLTEDDVIKEFGLDYIGEEDDWY